MIQKTGPETPNYFQLNKDSVNEIAFYNKKKLSLNEKNSQNYDEIFDNECFLNPQCNNEFSSNPEVEAMKTNTSSIEDLVTTGEGLPKAPPPGAPIKNPFFCFSSQNSPSPLPNPQKDSDSDPDIESLFMN